MIIFFFHTSGITNFVVVAIIFFFHTSEVTNFVVTMSSFTSRRGHQFCSDYVLNHSTTNLNNNSVYNFDSLYKNIINVTKYIITKIFNNK